MGEGESPNALDLASPIEPPDFSSEPVEQTPNGYDRFGWRHHDGWLWTSPRRLIRLIDCSVLRSSMGRDRWHIVSADGKRCAVDSYHDGEWLGKHIGESVGSLNLRDDAPIEWHVQEPAVLISHLWAENYAHSLLETASRFWFLEERPELGDLPVVWDLNTPWQRELADWLCPGRACQLPANHVRFDSLWVPSFYSQIGSSAASVRWLRERFKVPDHPRSRRIMVSRADANKRRIANEDQVFALLEPLGFERVVLTGLRVSEQMMLFESAGVVVLPHGAGAANMIFSGTGTRFIEILPRSYAHPMFGHIAKWSGHWYGRIVADCDANEDMTVDLGVLRRALDAAEV